MEPERIYFDMDGVLADFVRGVRELCGLDMSVGDDIMFVLVGGDIRPHVIDALQSLVGEIKNHCVLEEEIY